VKERPVGTYATENCKSSPKGSRQNHSSIVNAIVHKGAV